MDLGLQTKQEYRTHAKEQRNRLNMQEISKQICCNIRKQDFYLSQNILSFFPFNNEIDLKELYKDTSKNWYLPRIESKSLIIHSYKYGNSLIKNKWGVYEPCCDLEEVDLRVIDLVIIPALMVDKKGHRLGYGAGFYDRFIPGLRKDCLKIVPIPEELFIDSLPHDHWDIPVNKAVTQERIISFISSL